MCSLKALTSHVHVHVHVCWRVHRDDGFKPSASERNVSESVLSTALAIFVFPRISSVLRMDPAASHAALKAADRADVMAEGLRKAMLASAWDDAGGWLRRAWLGPTRGWVGSSSPTDPDGGIFSSVLGWALLADAFKSDPKKQTTAIASLLSECGEERAFGFNYRCRKGVVPAGSGAWPAQNHPMIIGLAARATANATDAWDEFERNSLQHQAAMRPDRWVGIWTSADEVRRDGLPGNWTWPFPALCTHRHAWPLYSFSTAFMGLQPTAGGVRFRPGLPPALGHWEFSTPLMGASWDGVRTWNGHYAPNASGAWLVEIDLSLVMLDTDQRVEVTLVATRDEECCERGECELMKIEAHAVGLGGVVEVRSPVRARRVDWSVRF